MVSHMFYATVLGVKITSNTTFRENKNISKERELFKVQPYRRHLKEVQIGTARSERSSLSLTAISISRKSAALCSQFYSQPINEAHYTEYVP